MAKTYSELFAFDRPASYDCGGKTAVILTEKGSLFKLNLEAKQIDRLQGASMEEEAQDEASGIV